MYGFTVYHVQVDLSLQYVVVRLHVTYSEKSAIFMGTLLLVFAGWVAYRACSV